MNTLSIGDKAPSINSVDQNGNKITLNQFLGKKVILYFYPTQIKILSLELSKIYLIMKSEEQFVNDVINQHKENLI